MNEDAAAGRYALLRFNPDPIRGEMINVGVLLDLMDGRILSAFVDEARPAWFHPGFHLAIHRMVVEGITDHIEQGWTLDRFIAKYGGTYEFTEAHMTLLDEDPQRTLARLADRLVHVWKVGQ